ncbi:hypothetical protein [Cellvibrio sp. pealriver]|uniref:hypothetical protein n=1 Tax=Cellvibrio sp. pealriver TaxID=1622269 RepID=UPI00066FC7D4|nr:hypothetical protein [Cellvibrio sp. pealriver]
MHTLMVLVGGFVLLFFCQLVARVFGGEGVKPIAKALVVFVPLWFVIAAINMWVGIHYAGYTFMQELPIFLLVFAVPAVAALLTWWRITHLQNKKKNTPV